MKKLAIALLLLVSIVVGIVYAQPTKKEKMPWDLDPPFGQLDFSVYVDYQGNQWLAWDSESVRWICLRKGDSRLTRVRIEKDGIYLHFAGDPPIRVDKAAYVEKMLRELLGWSRIYPINNDD